MLRRALPVFLFLAATPSASSSPGCAECHSEIFQRQLVSRHAQALRPFVGSRMMMALERAPVAGVDYVYRYRGAVVRASRPGHTVEATLDWAFGAGSSGFTAVGSFEGRFFEHRVSWFVAPGKPAVTPGQPEHGELGVFKTPSEAFACFNCHSTGLERSRDSGPAIATMTPGIQCERCHGPGAMHVQAAHLHRPAAETRNAIFDGGRLAAKASVEVCGGCHRTRADLNNSVTVRFQPVGLMASRCFRDSGELSCVTCHDPHTDAVKNNAEFYTGKCRACHAEQALASSACRRNAEENCVPCHMKKAVLAPGLTFTDHRIR